MKSCVKKVIFVGYLVSTTCTWLLLILYKVPNHFAFLSFFFNTGKQIVVYACKIALESATSLQGNVAFELSNVLGGKAACFRLC